MRMISAFALGCMLSLGACSVAPTPSPGPTPSAAQTRAPSAVPTPGPVDTEAPEPSVGQIIPTPEDLLAGVRRDLQGKCTPIQVDLPPAAVAGIECLPKSDVVTSVTLYLFGGQQDLLDTYMTRLVANGVTPRTNGGRCLVGRASEGGYVPGDGHVGVTVTERGGCYLDANGKAHYVATLPPFILIEVNGSVGNIAAVERWAWRGNQDQPGAPTIWRSNDQ